MYEKSYTYTFYTRRKNKNRKNSFEGFRAKWSMVFDEITENKGLGFLAPGASDSLHLLKHFFHGDVFHCGVREEATD